MSSLNGLYDLTLTSLRTQMRNMTRLSEQATSGSRVLHASDSPGDAYEIMHYMSQSQSLDAYMKNIDTLSLDMGQASIVLESISTSLTRAQTLLSQAASGTYSQEQRVSLGQEIDSLLEEIVGNINTPSMGRYLFGGAMQSAPAYEALRDESGKITAVNYEGVASGTSVSIGLDVEQKGTLVGEEVFRSASRQQPQLLGSTGVKAASGATSSVRGDVVLSVTHTQSFLDPMTGMSLGASSSSKDTVVGIHTLTVDADARTVRLDDGPSVSFGPGDTDFAVTNSAGAKVYINASGFDTSLTGTYELELEGQAKASIDGGRTSVVMNFSAIQGITDSTTGRILYIDATAINQSGIENVRVPGTYDLFGMMIGVRDLMLNKAGLSSSQQSQLLNQAISSMDEVKAGITQQMTAAGSQLNALDSMRSSLENIKTRADDQITTLQEVDVAELSVQLAKAQSFYEMTLLATSKMLNLSLLDYMQ